MSSLEADFKKQILSRYNPFIVVCFVKAVMFDIISIDPKQKRFSVRGGTHWRITSSTLWFY